MKGKQPSTAKGVTAVEHEFERLLRRAARIKAAGSSLRLRKVSRRKRAA